jgi:hypothetical protein
MQELIMTERSNVKMIETEEPEAEEDTRLKHEIFSLDSDVGSALLEDRNNHLKFNFNAPKNISFEIDSYQMKLGAKFPQS